MYFHLEIMYKNVNTFPLNFYSKQNPYIYVSLFQSIRLKKKNIHKHSRNGFFDFKRKLPEVKHEPPTKKSNLK